VAQRGQVSIGTGGAFINSRRFYDDHATVVCGATDSGAPNFIAPTQGAE
jgi:hypothetical protein